MPNYVNPIKILKEKIKLQEINKKVGFEWIKIWIALSGIYPIQKKTFYNLVTK